MAIVTCPTCGSSVSVAPLTQDELDAIERQEIEDYFAFRMEHSLAPEQDEFDVRNGLLDF